MKTIYLLSCCKTKLPFSAPAENLYQSAGFKKSLAYARSQNPDAIYILSAKHHLVELSQELAPYDECLKDKSKVEIQVWSASVAEQLSKKTNLQEDRFVILCGKNYYCELLRYLNNYELPLEGLGLGKRLAWFDQNTKSEDSDCYKIHQFFNSLPQYSYPFDEEKIPENGIYVFFEKGETYKGMNRIVRVGTHTGDGQLLSRIKQHLVYENKDRSIFRKNIGRALLNKINDSYLEMWNIDLTSRANKQKYQADIDLEKQNQIEKTVSDYMRSSLSFAVICIEKKEERLDYEAFLIRTISGEKSCRPSENWLGNFSPIEKIRKSGLWLVNELDKSIGEK